MKQVMDDLREKKNNLLDELRKPNTDNRKVKQLTTEIKVLVGKTIDLKTEDILAIKKIMTPEQFEKFVDMQKMRPGRPMDRKMENPRE